MSADDTQPAGVPPARPRPAPRPTLAAGPAAAAAPAAPRQRPDPRPMRLALGAGTIAAVSIMAAGLVRFPTPSGGAVAADPAAAADAPVIETLATARPEVRIQHRTVYVHLRPGQHAPKGAKVIAGKVPPPRVVVTTLPGRAATTRVRRAPQRVAVVTKTRQSGH